MAKGQKRSTREAKKPKASAKKLAPPTTGAGIQLPPRPLPSKSAGK
jgi:hypothetical protein